MRCLFVGGESDGQYLEVTGGDSLKLPRRWNVPTKVKAPDPFGVAEDAPDMISHETYGLRHYRDLKTKEYIPEYHLLTK